MLAGESTARRAAAAGLLTGVAVLLSYQAAIAVPALGLALAARSPSRRPLAAFLAGGLPPLALFVAIHWVCFGSPLATAYDFQNPQFTGGRASGYLAALTRPIASRLWGVLCGPYRGLLFYSPVAGAAIAAAVSAVRRGRGERRLAAAVALAVLAFFVLVTAIHPVWWGGFSTGPRLLVPALALLAPFAAFAFEMWPRATSALAFISVLNALATTAVSVVVDESIRNPLLSSIYPGLAAGNLGRRNLGLDLGLSPLSSLLPYLAIAGLLTLALAVAVSIRPRTS